MNAKGDIVKYILIGQIFLEKQMEIKKTASINTTVAVFPV